MDSNRSRSENGFMTFRPLPLTTGLRLTVLALALSACLAAQWKPQTVGAVTVAAYRYSSCPFAALGPLVMPCLPGPVIEGIGVIVGTTSVETTSFRLVLRYRGSDGQVRIADQTVKRNAHGYSLTVFYVGRAEPVSIHVEELRHVSAAEFAVSE